MKYSVENIKSQKEKRAKSQNLPLLDTVLILCEGEKTEPNYFNSIVNEYQLGNIKICGTATNTDKIVEEAIKHQKKYSKIWCVFDKDNFPAQSFNRAFQLTKNYPNIYIAYSNEAFEIWYLLHFNYYDTGMSRTQYKEKLSDLLGFVYKKNSKEMYNYIKDKEQTAMRNAEKLIKSYGDNIKYVKANPSTTVYKLVKELNDYGNKL